MPDLDDLVDKFVSGKSLEGDSGCQTLTELVEALGYNRSGFQFGEPIERFLSDNPGAQEALVNWISEQRVPEWVESLQEVVDSSDDDEDGESGDYDDHDECVASGQHAQDCDADGFCNRCGHQ